MTTIRGQELFSECIDASFYESDIAEYIARVESGKPPGWEPCPIPEAKPGSPVITQIAAGNNNSMDVSYGGAIILRLCYAAQHRLPCSRTEEEALYPQILLDSMATTMIHLHTMMFPTGSTHIIGTEEYLHQNMRRLKNVIVVVFASAAYDTFPFLIYNMKHMNPSTRA